MNKDNSRCLLQIPKSYCWALGGSLYQVSAFLKVYTAEVLSFLPTSFSLIAQDYGVGVSNVIFFFYLFALRDPKIQDGHLKMNRNLA